MSEADGIDELLQLGRILIAFAMVRKDRRRVVFLRVQHLLKIYGVDVQTSSPDEQVVQDADGPMCDCGHPQVAHSHSGCKVKHVQANGFFLYCTCRCNFGRQFEDSVVAEKYSTRV